MTIMAKFPHLSNPFVHMWILITISFLILLIFYLRIVWLAPTVFVGLCFMEYLALFLLLAYSLRLLWKVRVFVKCWIIEEEQSEYWTWYFQPIFGILYSAVGIYSFTSNYGPLLV